jgi:microcompartment protein CcmL/EutN
MAPFEPRELEALALVELDSVASGLRALDALVKKAPVTVLEANLVEPGKFLVLVAGPVGELAEAFEAATAEVPEAVGARMFLARVDARVVDGLRGRDDRDAAPEAIGLVEGRAVAPLIEACDRSLKDATVRLAGIRVAGGLGGRAYYVVSGRQHDVEAALDAGRTVLEAHGALHRVERIANPHGEMMGFLLRPTPFAVVDRGP